MIGISLFQKVLSNENGSKLELDDSEHIPLQMLKSIYKIESYHLMENHQQGQTIPPWKSTMQFSSPKKLLCLDRKHKYYP